LNKKLKIPIEPKIWNTLHYSTPQRNKEQWKRDSTPLEKRFNSTERERALAENSTLFKKFEEKIRRIF